MLKIRTLLITAALVLGGCAATTQVVPLNPAQVYPPTRYVEVLLQKPARPHVEIALLESRGGSEADLFNDAREKAAAIGADAIVKLETEREYYPPVAMYDPWADPFYWGPYPYRYRHYGYGPFSPFFPVMGPYYVVPGGYSYILKTTAIRYLDRSEPPAPATK